MPYKALKLTLQVGRLKRRQPEAKASSCVITSYLAWVKGEAHPNHGYKSESQSESRPHL
jgi:hypothetical protein